jgi:hypothetical protein
MPFIETIANIAPGSESRQHTVLGAFCFFVQPLLAPGGVRDDATPLR